MASHSPWLWIGGAALAGGVVALISRAAEGSAFSGPDLLPSDCSTSAVPSAYCADYVARWAACEVRADKIAAADRIVDRIMAIRDRYATVIEQTGVPWWFLGAVHSLESDLSFSRHIHNGDPLTGRTYSGPEGRPPTGEPPFTWNESALDSMQYQGLTRWTDWSVAGALYQLERYNGMGYRRIGIPSPYLWSFTNQYTRGKYVSDGVYDPNAVSQQCGGAAIWKRMIARGLLGT